MRTIHLLVFLALSDLSHAQDSWTKLEPHFSLPPEFANDFGNYRSPMIFADGSKVKTPGDWETRRTELKKEWEQRLGQWPDLITDPEVEVLESTRRNNFTQRRIRFHWTPVEQTTGYLLIPDGEDRHPAVLTVYYDPETAIGLGEGLLDFAYQLTTRGFVTLSVGSTGTTEDKTYATYFPDIDSATVEPLSMLGCAAANCWHVLAAQPEVDSERIGIIGHSYGGKWSIFAGCLFDRFAAVAVSDPGIMFDTHPSVNYWEPWYLGWHPRPWRKRGVPHEENPARGLYAKLLTEGRDLHEIHALLAPRPFFVSGGEVDPPERWCALNHLVQIQRLLGYKNRVGMTNRPKHPPTHESNEMIYAFFEHFLKDPAP